MLTSEGGRSPSPRHAFLDILRELLEIIRDYGLPTVAFGVGIYAFILILEVPGIPEIKAAVAGGLTLAGLFAQLWVYTRANPRKHSDEVSEQLARMTRLVERLTETSIRNNRNRGNS
jgi:hypothetical protein